MQTKMDYWAGYTFGMPLGNQWRWCAGVVLTPRWAKKAKNDCLGLPIMLDNGAFPAWRDGIEISAEEQITSMINAIEVLGSVPERIILPDIVAGGYNSFDRSVKSIPSFAKFGLKRLWLPIQENMNLNDALFIADILGGVFIGGACKKWKMDTVAKIRKERPEMPIHVGRISKSNEMSEAVSSGVTSFDTTTFMRQQKANKKINWLDRFKSFVEVKIMGENVILLSGGPDSVALLQHCKNRNLSVACGLWIDYGQPARKKEYEHAKKAAEFYGVRLEVRKVKLNLGDMGDMGTPQVVPGRNAVLVSIAANVAASCGADCVMIGCVMEDAKNYPDCTTQYARALSAITKPFGVQVLAPWTYQRKSDVMAMIPEGLNTWSCYSGGNRPCETCKACEGRLQALGLGFSKDESNA